MRSRSLRESDVLLLQLAPADETQGGKLPLQLPDIWTQAALPSPAPPIHHPSESRHELHESHLDAYLAHGQSGGLIPTDVPQPEGWFMLHLNES